MSLAKKANISTNQQFEERAGVTEQGHLYRDRWCVYCSCLHRYFTGYAPANGVARTPDIAREAAQSVWDRFWGDFQSEYILSR